MTAFGAFQDPTQTTQAMFKQAQEGTQTWFKIVTSLLEESDKQLADSYKLMGPAHEPLLATRNNVLKFAQETTERALALSESAMTASLGVWSVK